jgi:hypothetical protein
MSASELVHLELGRFCRCSLCFDYYACSLVADVIIACTFASYVVQEGVRSPPGAEIFAGVCRVVLVLGRRSHWVPFILDREYSAKPES